MRLFIAIEMNRSIEEASREVIDELRDRAARLAPRARITRAMPERLHVTVRFIGETDEARGLAVRSALGPTIDAPVFDVTVEGVGAFPPKGPPRVFWAGLTEGRSGIIDVERAVSARLESIVAADERPYSPHLTLARVKDPAGIRREELLEGLAGKQFGRVHVDAITLFESRLSRNGPTYVPLQRTALRRRT
jgi:2'-5' RNA ligase